MKAKISFLSHLFMENRDHKCDNFTKNLWLFSVIYLFSTMYGLLDNGLQKIIHFSKYVVYTLDRK